MSDDILKSNPNEQLELIVSPEYDSLRLDKFLSEVSEGQSRNQIQLRIKKNLVTVDEQVVSTPKHKVSAGQRVVMQIVTFDNKLDYEPKPLDLNILYQDNNYLVLNKPAGLVTHPSAGHWDISLQQGVAWHFEQVLQLPRWGMIHRLDIDTTGAIIFALNNESLLFLQDMLAQHIMRRTYTAVVKGIPVTGKTVNLPIGRHRTDRKLQAVSPQGRNAITHFTVREKYTYHAQLQVVLETGRTHQIRVHMASIGYPILGDVSYGGKQQLIKGAPAEFIQTLQSFNRQALHAEQLQIPSMDSDEMIIVDAPLPHDMSQLLLALDHHRH